MAHQPVSFPRSVEIGAVKRIQWMPEIVTSDGGYEVRNQRQSRAKIYYDVAMPTCTRDNAGYLAVLQMFQDTLGGVDTFDFIDWTDETGATKVKVRFDGEISLTGVAGHLDHIDTFTLVEVFDE